MVRQLGVLLIGLALLPLWAFPDLLAQSSVGAAIDVELRAPSNPAGSAGATVTVSDLRTGQRFERLTNESGRALFDGLTPGGPYSLSARAVGFHPAEVRDLQLTLGQRLPVILELAPEAVTLPEITATTDIRRSTDRTGPSFTVSDTSVRRLPLLNRDFVDLIQTAPEVSGTSVAGTNNRYNNLLIDGGSDNDFFGLSRGTGAPGGQIGVRSLPLEAVREFQVLTAPFDVRQGNFTGGQINAVTQSGTNQFHGAAFSYYQGQDLAGKDTTGARPSEFNNWQFGGAAGGPLVRDRLHFFIAGELRRRTAPFTGPIIAPGSTVGISVDSAERFSSILRNYGLDPGSFGAFTTHNQSGNVFAKLSGSLGSAGQLEGSLNYTDGEITDTIAPPRAVNGDYRLTSAGFAPGSTQWGTRIRWSSLLSQRVNNELFGGYLHISEPRTPSSGYPAVFVGGVGDPGFTAARLVAGADPSSQQLTLTQRAFELTDNASFDLGQHTVTAGAHVEFLHFDFFSLGSAIGQYQFTSLDAFAAGTAARFTRSIALRPGGAEAIFGASQLGFYLQDRWTPLPELSITAGLRVDIPHFGDKPPTNDALLSSPFAINTGTFIKTTPLWGPRLGFNWQADRVTALRGGVGMFSGRLPYSWISFAFTQTGNDAISLNCSGPAAPAFNPDPNSQPTACLTPAAAGAPTVSYFNSNFKLPQTLKVSLGVDRELGWGVVASIDGLYQHGYRQPYIVDRNLTDPIGALAAEGGRLLYGGIAASSTAGLVATTTPSKVSTAFGPVLETSYRNSDRTWLATVQARKRFTSSIEANVAYTYTDARDLMSLRDAQVVSNYGFVSLDGSLAARSLGTSVFSTPHKVTVSGTVNLPADVAFSLTYIGRSGLPFTYVVNGDANADGVGNRAGAFDRQQNDPVYVPRDLTDGEFVRDSVTTPPATVLVPDPTGAQRLEDFVTNEQCLQQARGTLLQRNRCRNPWQSILNTRLAKRLALSGQSIELSLDVFNLLHLIDSDWGLIRETGSFASAGTENVPLLKLRGQDAAAGRNLYEVTLPAREAINVEASRWRLQLGARYAF
jgi:hypothetical protein